MGPYFNFNFLMERANGKYFIFFPDDDDYSDEHLIKQYVSALEEHPRAALAFATIQCIDGSGTVFEEDKPPYHLDGSLLHRFWTYLAFNITDHIMYGMFRTSSLCPYRFECDVPTPEKFLILHALAKGPMIDCYSTSYRNHYSFKSPDEIALLFERPPTRNHVLVWIRCAATKIRFPHSILVILLYLFLRAPKLSWPVRQLFGFPRAHPGRTCREPVKKKWKFE
jgi:glycosyltransferase involved in cell wall biosynthesis